LIDWLIDSVAKKDIHSTVVCHQCNITSCLGYSDGMQVGLLRGYFMWHTSYFDVRRTFWSFYFTVLNLFFSLCLFMCSFPFYRFYIFLCCLL